MKRILLAGLLLLILGVAAAGAWLYLSVERPFKGYEGNETFVEIQAGSGPITMGRALTEAGVVPSVTAFRTAVWVRGAGRRLQAGEYRFERPMTPLEVVDKIARGDVYLQPVTFREGLTIRQMAQIFQERRFGTAQEFITAASRADRIRSIDPSARDLEGYLFPDTYTLPRRATAEQLVERMVARFEAALSPEVREQAAARGLTVRQLVTLASLVEKETARREERPLVSAVYSNRLRIGMGLQCDPTVIYALERAGRFDGNLTRDDLRFDSPYNTYRYAGLPPGPIAAPGKASLEAAANPADVPYIYFVSRNDGSHAFASTLEEHNRNVHQWQVLYHREKRLRQQ
ncbi:MAG TPA: endolytic transglycosylase MltG [Vicinamibacterales bacterium]|nr:endolytic transglycosylase MltG [Vicinamibacterales bacterium]